MYSVLGSDCIHPARIAMASVLQHAEGISDRQASERMDDSLIWKYATRTDLNETGWDPSVYCDFRTRLLNSGAADLLLDKLLHVAEEKGLIDSTKLRTDATHICSAAKLMSRIELVFECVFDCLNELMDEAPKFLLSINKEEWRKRYYTMRAYNYQVPNTDNAKQKLANTIGSDAKYILEKIDESADKERLNGLMSVQILRRVLSEQFKDSNDGPSFLKKEELSRAGDRIASPHDLDATCASKRGKTWLGNKVHFSETYGANAPHLIVNVKTTPAHVNDCLVLDEIHRELKTKGRKPETHLVDAGYADVDTLIKCSQHDEIDVLTRVSSGNSWQSKADKGFDLSHFIIHWDKKVVVCPAGVESDAWKTKGGDNGVVNASFPKDKCTTCPFKQDCTQSNSRKLQFKAQSVFEFLQKYRQRQNTDEFKAEYSNRSGSEGTISQLVRRSDIRRSPYIGREKTHLANVLAATAINIIRIGNWLLGIGVSKTRKTRYEMLMSATAA